MTELSPTHYRFAYRHSGQSVEPPTVGDATSDIIACRKVGIPVVAAAWAETAEPEKLKALNPDEMFYTIKLFKLVA